MTIIFPQTNHKQAVCSTTGRRAGKQLTSRDRSSEGKYDPSQTDYGGTSQVLGGITTFLLAYPSLICLPSRTWGPFQAISDHSHSDLSSFLPINLFKAGGLVEIGY